MKDEYLEKAMRILNKAREYCTKKEIYFMQYNRYETLIINRLKTHYNE